MSTSRLEAFSDGVLAIIITVMVLTLAIPSGSSISSLIHTSGIGLLTYLLSFIYIGIYWNNHHHFFTLTTEVDGSVMWANLHLLFWLSLFPFTTRWVTQTHVAAVPTAVYGIDLMGAGVAYYLMYQLVIRRPGGAQLKAAIGHDRKGEASVVLYAVGIGLAFVEPWLGLIPYVAVAILWLIPDRRVERYVAAHANESSS